MYARRISHNFGPTPHNLRSMLPEKPSENLLSKCSLVMKRQFSEWHKARNLRGKLDIIIDKARLVRQMLFTNANPEETLKMWARQVEFVFAQRVRRGQQMICLYNKWWEERALKEFLKRLRISISKNGKEFIIGATGLSLYNWEENRIKEDEFVAHLGDIEYIDHLKEQTMCMACSKSSNKKETAICKCGSLGITNRSLDGWEPFVEKEDLVVWRRKHGETQFEYKVYGSYHDVCAEDFLNVQVDTDYRKEWDTTAVQLEIGEKDPIPDSNSDILYWEMKWPRLFVNRDYVFNRRYKVFDEEKKIVIVNKTTEYPKFPKYPDKYRVEEYWSFMVIKPWANMRELGIEFSLTYFDNPGVNIPASITTWVAKSAMPDFLAKLRLASRNYRDYCLRKGISKGCEIYKQEEKARKEEEEKNKLEYCSNDKIRAGFKEMLDEFQRKAEKRFFKQSEGTDSGSVVKIIERAVSAEEIQTQQLAAANSPKIKHDSFWKYLHPMYYFT